MKISVILPVYNADRYLRLAIESILQQSYKNFELLIIDDGSTDTSSEIIRSFRDPRIRPLRNEENIGLIRTLNRGVVAVEGEYILRMDADDISLPTRLEKQVQWMECHPQVVACGTYGIRIDAQGIMHGLIKRPRGELVQQYVWLPTPLLHPSVILRSKIAKENLYDYKTLHCEDYELWLRLVSRGYKIDNLPEPLLLYRIHGDGISLRNRELQLQKSHEIFKNYFPNVKIDFEHYCALVGAEGFKLSVLEHISALNMIYSPKSVPLLVIVQEAIRHFKSRIPL